MQPYNSHNTAKTVRDMFEHVVRGKTTPSPVAPHATEPQNATTTAALPAPIAATSTASSIITAATPSSLYPTHTGAKTTQTIPTQQDLVPGRPIDGTFGPNLYATGAVLSHMQTSLLLLLAFVLALIGALCANVVSLRMPHIRVW